MIKVLGLVHGELSSHTVRILAIAKAMRDSGNCEILFSGTGSFMERVAAEGFACVDSPNVSKKELYQRLSGSLVTQVYDRSNAEEIFQGEDQLLRKHQPDIIVRDLFREMAAVSAKQPDNRVFDVFIQKAALCPYYHFDFRPETLPAWLDVFPKGTLRPFARRIENLYRKRNSRLLRKKAASLDLSEYVTIEGVRPDLVLFPEAKEIFPLPEAPTDRCKHIGPILVPSTQEPPAWLDSFRSDSRKKILISMGTSGEHENRELLLNCFSTDRYATALYTTVGTSIPGCYGGHDFDIAAVLPYCDVFVHHGGTGNSYLALKHAVPTLTLHDHFEQQVNAVEFERAGISINLRKRDRRTETIASAIRELTENPAYRAACERVSREVFAEDPLKLAVQYIRDGYKQFRSGIER